VSKKEQVVTLLTLIVVVLWVISAIVRIWQPWPIAGVLDSAMPLVIGYWFVAKGAATA
jgi:uncharacterized MnhB-related membrane protein